MRTKELPIRLWGFYEADQLYEPLKTLYQREFNAVVLKPTQQSMEAQLYPLRHRSIVLRSDIEDSENNYSLFKAYLMMADRKHLNSPFLAKQLQRMWGHSVPVSSRKGQLVLEESREVGRSPTSAILQSPSGGR